MRGSTRRDQCQRLTLAAALTLVASHSSLVTVAEAAELEVVDQLAVGGSISSPVGGIGRYQNLLAYSEDLTQAAWARTNVVSVNLDATTPDGTTNGAATITGAATGASNLAQTVTGGITPSSPYTFSVWLKQGTSTNAQLELTGNGTGETPNVLAVTLTNSWERYSLSHTTASNTGSLTVTIKNLTASSSILAWGAQLEQGNPGGVYVKTTATPVTTTGRGIVSNKDFLVVGSQTISGGQTVSGDQTVTGHLTVQGNTTLGNEAADVVNFAVSPANVRIGGVQIASSHLADGAQVAHVNAAETLSADWGNTAFPWQDSEVSDTLTITAGSVAGAVIGSGINAATLTVGTLDDARLSASVSRLGPTIEASEVTDGTLTAQDLSSGSVRKRHLDELRPHAQTSPNNTVVVEGGIVAVHQNEKLEFPTTTSPAFAPVVTGQSRIDLLVLTRTGVLEIVSGTPAVSPTAPAYPRDKLCLAEVTITETTAPVITDADLKDVRFFLAMEGSHEQVEPTITVGVTSDPTATDLRLQFGLPGATQESLTLTGTTTDRFELSDSLNLPAGEQYLIGGQPLAFGDLAGPLPADSYASTYVNTTGDAMTGALTLPANGLTVGTNQLVASGGNVGIGTASPSPSARLDVNGLTRTTSLQTTDALALSRVGYITFNTDQLESVGTIKLMPASAGETVLIGRGASLSFGTGNVIDTTAIYQEGANTLGIRNGAGAQTLRLYNTFTDALNYERLALRFASNVAELRTEAAGTGVVRDIAVMGGNLGIGTTGPTHKLDVAGSARISGTLASEAAYDPLNDGLMLYLPFSDASGTTATDKSARGNHGTLTNSPSWVDGKLGKALSVPGLNDHVRIASPAADLYKFAANQDFTVCAWIKTADSTYWHQPVGNESANNRTGFSFVIGEAAAGIPYFTSRNICCPAAAGTTPVNDNQWHYLVGVRRGDQAFLYVDGRLEGTLASGAGVSFANAQDLFIGQDPNNYFQYNGLVDEVRIYTRALSADEARGLYERGLGAQAPYTQITTGKVGIGTTAPAVPLDVAGELRASRLEVDAATSYIDTSGSNLIFKDPSVATPLTLSDLGGGAGGGGSAPKSAPYLVNAADSVLTNEVVVGSLTANLAIKGDGVASRAITLGQQVVNPDVINLDVPPANVRIGGQPLNFTHLSGTLGDTQLATGAVDLDADEVAGILPIAKGGTNNTSPYTAGSLIFSDGTKLTQDNPNLLWDDVNNRLGIGTASPTTALSLAPTSTIRIGAESVAQAGGMDITAPASNNGGRLDFYHNRINDAGGPRGRLELGNLASVLAIRDWGDLSIGAGAGGGDAKIHFGNATSVSAVVPQMTLVTGSGNLGLGTTNPSAKLDVVGDIQGSGQLSTPFGGLGRYENLLIKSEELDLAPWGNNNAVTVTANTATAPDGTTSAERLVFDVNAGTFRFQPRSGLPASTSYTGSIWLRADANIPSVELMMQKARNTGGTEVAQTGALSLTTTWQRFSVTLNAGSTADGPLDFGIRTLNTSAPTIYTWGAQLEQAGSPGAYARTTTNAIAAGRGLVVSGKASLLGDVDLGDLAAHTIRLKGTVKGSSPTLIVDQETTADLADFRDSGTSVFKIADGGAITASGPLTIDSLTFHVDSVTDRVGIGTTSPAYTLDIQGPGGGGITTLGMRILDPTNGIDVVLRNRSAHLELMKSGVLLLRTGGENNPLFYRPTGIGGDAVRGMLDGGGGYGGSGNAMLAVAANTASQVPLALKGISGQTADLLQIQDPSNNVLVNVTSAGNVGIGISIPTGGLLHLEKDYGRSVPTLLYLRNAYNRAFSGSGASIAFPDGWIRGINHAMSSNSMEIGGGSTAHLHVQTTPNPGSVGIGATDKLSRLTVVGAPDVTDVGGTTTANASTTITGIGTNFLNALGLGDRIALSSAPSTYATITSITDNATLTVDTPLGNGTAQTINVKRSLFRLDDAAGAPKLVVNDQGRLGLGTLTPAGALHMLGGDLVLGPPSIIHDATANEDLFVRGNLVVDGQIVQHQGTGTNTFETLTVSGNTFLATTSGSVGIGTASPQVPLHVSYNAPGSTTPSSGAIENTTLKVEQLNALYRAEALFTRTGGASLNLGVTRNSQGAPYRANVAFVRTSGDLDFYVADNPPAMLLSSAGNLGLGTAYALPGSRMEIIGSGATSATSSLHVKNSAGTSLLFARNDGNLGIGTASPSAKLHLIGPNNGSPALIVGGGASGDLRLYDNAGSGHPGIGSSSGIVHLASVLNGTGGSEVLRVRKSAGGSRIQEWQANNGSVLNVIDGAGNLGIGTTSPGGKLHVVGRDDAADVIAFMPGADTTAAGTPDLKMGIGMATPAATLDVQGDAQFGTTTKSRFTSTGALNMGSGQGITLSGGGLSLSGGGGFQLSGGGGISISGGGAISGLPNPVADADAANKAYVDSQVASASGGWTRDTPNARILLSNLGDRVGIGTATPSSGAKLHVEGQCVTGDTLLAIAECGTRNGECQVRGVPIKEVEAGMLVYSLNEESGTLEPRRINGLLDMGIQPVFRLTTASGRSIRTTGNHPYLTKEGWRKVVDLQIGGEIAVPQDERVARANESSWRGGAGQSRRTTQRPAPTEALAPTSRSLYSWSLPPSVGMDQDADHRENGEGTPQAHPSDQRKFSEEHARYANRKDRFRQISQELGDNLQFVLTNGLHALHALSIARPVFLSNVAWASAMSPRESSPTVRSIAPHLTPGSLSDTEIRWESIRSIEPVGREPVYDIEVEGTHNFVANGLIAHNTYLSGNVGIGTESPAKKLHVDGDVQLGGTGYGSLYPGFGRLFLRAEAGSAMPPSLVFQDFDAAAKTMGFNFVTDGTTPGTRMDVTNSSGSTLYSLTESGNVGIGTGSGSPESRLNVIGPGNGAGGIDNIQVVVQNSDAFAAGKGGGIALAGKYDAAGNRAYFGSIFGLKENATGGDYKGYLSFHSNPGSGSVEAMRISAGGNVGIGTPSPGYKLDVQGGQLNSSGGLCIAGECKTAWSQVGGVAAGESPTWTGAHTFTNTTAPIKIKPSSAPTASTKLFDMQATGAGTTNFSVDAEGDVVANSLLAGGGSTAAPSYSFAGNPTKGMFIAGTALALTSDGATNSLLINMNGTVQTNAVFTVNTNGTASSPALVVGGNSTTGWLSPSNGAIALSNNGTESLRVNSSGEMGLGMSPTSGYRLSVGGGHLLIAGGGGLRLPDGSAGTPAATFYSQTNIGLFKPGMNEVALAINGSEHLRFRGSGYGAVMRVSRGTDDASGYLVEARKARGSVGSPAAIASGDDLFMLSASGYVGPASAYVEAARLLMDSEGAIADSGAGLGGSIVLQTRPAGGSLTDRLTILGSGNVGIGTTSPGQKLEINGGIRLNTATTKPACDPITRGTFWVAQGGVEVKDTVEICAKDASDAYAWRTIY